MTRSDHQAGSGLGEQLLVTGVVDPVDESLSDEASIGLEQVLRPAAPARGRGGGLPLGDQGGPVELGGATLDDAGDDPLHLVASGTRNDHGSSRVLLASGVGAVDGVGADDVVVGVTADGEVAGESREVHEEQSEREDQDPPGATHEADPTEGRSLSAETLVLPRWLKAIGAIVALLIGAALAFAIFEPIQVLPQLRLAPGYSLTTAEGERLTSEDQRGSVTLYTFSRTDCGDSCESIDRTMAEVRDGVDELVDLGDVEFRLVTIALDPIEDPPALAEAESAAGADGERWQWVGGTEAELANVVGAGFRRPYQATAGGGFDPGFILVDGLGVVRGDYRYETLGDTADKLVRHVDILADELRYKHGAASLAYDAAHLFLCYP